MTTYIGTSWKMNKTTDEARRYVRQLNRLHSRRADVQTFVIPPHTALQAVRDELDPSIDVWIGAQNAHWAPSGPYTGEISMGMIKEVGATLVELGHSERRALFNETDESVALKVEAALGAGLTPLVCVGENAETRAHGGAVDHLLGQVEAVLSHIDVTLQDRVLLAYEPHWAIGESGTPASAAVVGEAASALRKAFTVKAILYGGSVGLGNARDYLVTPDIDGLFVGRSAWRAEDLVSLVELASDVLDESMGDAS